MNATERTSPMTRTTGCSRATAATPSTLSRDIEKSAMRIWVIACRTVLPGGRCGFRPSSSISSPPAAPGGRCCRSSIPSFHAIQRSRAPPTSSSPVTLRRLHRHEGEEDAQHRREGDAAHDHPPALVRGKSGRGECHRDRVVPGEDEVDQDDLGEGAQSVQFNRGKHALSGTRRVGGQPPGGRRARLGGFSHRAKQAGFRGPNAWAAGSSARRSRPSESTIARPILVDLAFPEVVARVLAGGCGKRRCGTVCESARLPIGSRRDAILGRSHDGDRGCMVRGWVVPESLRPGRGARAASWRV